MEAACSRWRAVAGRLPEAVRAREETEQILEGLNAFVYPVEGITAEDAEDALIPLLESRFLHSSNSVLQLAQLVSCLLSQQKLSLRPSTQDGLLQLFLSWLPNVRPPTELLYALASLTQGGAKYKDMSVPEGLLRSDSTLLLMALGSRRYDVTVQRAALHYAATLCNCLRSELPQPTLHSLLELLLQNLHTPPSSDVEPLLKTKYVLSLLRAVQAVLAPPSSLRSSRSLPSLLTFLKMNMVLGLPGQPKTTAFIQPPLNVSPVLHPHNSKSLSVAGPHQRRRRNRHKSREKQRQQLPVAAPPERPTSGSRVQSSRGGTSSSGGGAPSSRGGPSSSGGGAHSSGSSDSEQSAAGSFVVSKGHQHSLPFRPPAFPAPSSSDSELSDAESTHGRMRTVSTKLRYQAHCCLATIFQSLDHQTTFSYWFSFLPDGPRPPNSHPSLLTCILKDPSPKCRGAAASALSAMLEGSKSYLAAADDRPRPLQPFTAYSSTLGGVVKELHRSLLLALAAETHPASLTQIIKCLSLLVVNTPYHQLTEGYIMRLTAGLQGFTTHRDTDVHVACLTCFGAIVSIHPPLKEVEAWLGDGESPWLLRHCCSILQSLHPLSLQTETLQVLTALSKFYFSALSHCWATLQSLYLNHLVSSPEALQPHALRMLEELCRALSSTSPHPVPDTTAVCQFWEQLLSHSLTSLLQLPANSSLCSQACSVLATIGPATLQEIKVPIRVLALTLPLGLTRDETAGSSVVASAVRVLGVFVLYDCLKDDVSFLMDCQTAILHTLTSHTLTVRVQAAWALANLADALSTLPTSPSTPPTLPPSLVPPLYDAACTAVMDSEKVKCNGVRAAGNLLKFLNEQVLLVCRGSVDRLSSLLAKAINSGSMKSRWNACYACHSALINTLFTEKCSSSSNELLSALCVAVTSCKNFKVRTNAALALAAPRCHGYGAPDQFREVWSAVLQGLEGSEHQDDFSEFKHASTLRTQLCTTICHMLSVMDKDQASVIASLSLPDPVAKHLRDFVRSLFRESEGEPDRLAREAAGAVMAALEGQEPRGVPGGDSLHQLRQTFQDLLIASGDQSDH